MSDALIRLVPEDPGFQPDPSDAIDAEALMRSFMPDADRIDATFLDSVSFIDAGQNWSGVECPSCGADLDDWWSSAMESAYRTQFKNLVVKLPCCSRSISLNELDYGWTVAFGSWLLEARNPNRRALTRDELEALSKLVGAPLTQVVAHI